MMKIPERQREYHLSLFNQSCLSQVWVQWQEAWNGINRGAHGSRFWSIFDSFFVRFCRHRPSKMKWKMKRKMRTMNPTPLKFSKMRSKMSEKWNSTFFGTPAALNSASRCRPRFILSFSQCYLSASNCPWVLTNWSSVHRSVLSYFFCSFCSLDGENKEVITIWGNNKKDGQRRNALRQLEKLKTKNGWKMETCQKRTRCPFLKNGHFSVVFHLISGSVFHLIFLKNELKNGIKSGSKMRTVNTANHWF
jgi:hypothetical protein